MTFVTNTQRTPSVPTRICSFAAVLMCMSGAAQSATFNISGGNVASLISAINTCNTNNEDDTINLTAHATYSLTAVNNSTDGPNGLPVIRSDNNHSLLINGNGATISRSSASGTPEFRLLYVDTDPQRMLHTRSITLSRVILKNFSLSGSDEGVAVHLETGVININDCSFINNHFDGNRAALYHHAESLTLNRCTFENNAGGGVYCAGSGVGLPFGSATVNDCTFSGNRIPGVNGIPPGAAYLQGSSVGQLNNCTFDDNNDFETVNNNNSAIYNDQGDLTLASCTLNKTDFSAFDAHTFLRNNIFMDSKVGNRPDPTDPATEIQSQGNNISNLGNENADFARQTTDLTFTNPELDPAGSQDNGGPVETIALLPDSPAIDSGFNFGSIKDARGLPRPYDLVSVPNASGSNGSDRGAYEYNDQLQAGPNYIVNVTADHADDGLCGPAECTLREAISAANANSDESTIKFASNVTGIIQLTAVLPDLSTNLTVQGPGANVLEVHRFLGGNYRIFTVSNGTTTGPTVTVSGLTISNGVGTGTGTPAGGILNNHGVFTLSHCVVTGNSGGNGAGFENDGSVGGAANATLLNSTFRNNNATGFGGAIMNTAANGGFAIVNLTNCTIADNSASRGAAIYNTGVSGDGRLSLSSCTISNNSASFLGSIYTTGSSGSALVVFGNCIFKSGANGGNFATVSSTVTPIGNSVSNDAAGGDTGTGPGGLLTASGDKRNTDPLLDAGGLKNNGGTTQTIALLFGSPAIDTGRASIGPPQDQREYLRNGLIDIGAFEFNGQPVHFTSITHTFNDFIGLQAVGVPNGEHTLYSSSTPKAQDFKAIATFSADAAGMLEYTEYHETRGFYRVSFP